MSEKSHRIRNEILSIEVGLNLLEKLMGESVSNEQKQVINHLRDSSTKLSELLGEEPMQHAVES